MSHNPQYRLIFPSYDWDDAWLVNQIINIPEVLGAKNIGFAKGVPNEEIKNSDLLIKNWIDENMNKCSCLILFVGEKTYQSKWVKYELELANKLNKGRFTIFLEGMKNRFGNCCGYGKDPYEYHRLYTNNPTQYSYIIKQYYWKENNNVNNISEWIEDAISRAHT